MKMKHWMFVAVTLSTAVIAQSAWADDAQALTSTNAPPVASKPAAKKKRATTSALTKSDAGKTATPVAPGPAVVRERNANVRGQPAINSEIIARLKQGDHVTVLEEVTLKKPRVDEPAKWAKIALPTSSSVWVNSSYIDGTAKTVIPKKLRLRSGPGENYSTLGFLEKGTAVKEIETKGNWSKIEPPPQAYAFVASHLLAPETAAPIVVAAAEPPKPPAESPVAVVPPPAQPTEPVVTTPPTATPPPAEPAATRPPPPVEEILVKRVISREGIVRDSVSIQAPTYFVLRSLDSDRTINYLYSPSTNIVLRDFKGKRIIVTGEEALDERWPNTPVLTVETLQAVP